jgi:hypothetical protein
LRRLFVHLVIEADAAQNHPRSLNIRLVRSALPDTDRHQSIFKARKLIQQIVKLKHKANRFPAELRKAIG